MTLKIIVMILMREAESLDLNRALTNSANIAGPKRYLSFAKIISA
jgi:hypothetical protein